MEPGLHDGSWVVMMPRPGWLPTVGEVVVARHPERAGYEMIKRVAAVSRPRRLVWLAGDNRAESTDSDQFGPIPAALMVGRVILAVRPWPPRLLLRRPTRLWL